MQSQLQSLVEKIQASYITLHEQSKKILHADPSLVRQDSAQALITLLNQLSSILTEFGQFSVEKRAKYFNLSYNLISYILELVQFLRKSNYGFEAVGKILDCVIAMQNNVVLMDVKYLDRRTKLYLQIGKIYEQNECMEAAIAVFQNAIIKYKQLKAIHEMDPPVPAHVQTIINNNSRILKIMLFKYQVQAGSLNPNDWRKKIDQQFGDDMNLKLLSFVECLRTQTRKQSNIFQKNPQSAMSKNYKQPLLQLGFDMIKPYLQTLQKSLSQQKSKIQRELTFRNQEQTQELINQQIKKKRELQQKNIKISDFKKASSSFPLEYHVEMMHYAYQAKNFKMLATLLEVALIRCQCRRIEVPYLNDVGIIASSTPNPNIPNGYQKINIDLNQANLRLQLRKLRKKTEGKTPEQQKPAQVQKQAPKDAKKGAKDPKAPPVEQQKKPSNTPTEWQLKQINHKYVYMILKRTMSPESAVYNLNIVMGDEEKGPAGYIDSRRIIVPYIQEDMDIKSTQVSQYRGVRQSTHLVPYIILQHSTSGLENEQQKMGVLIDVKPLISKNPIMPPSWGYTKIPIDLRQVPQQFHKKSSHDYVYITYKTDELFPSCQRHTKILSALSQLDSATPPKPESQQQEKLLELGISYNLQKINNLFLTLQQCLDGKQGQKYYVDRCDFLTQLVYYLWSKYLRNTLVQFDYVNQMRLNQQIVDYQYGFYRDALIKCKPIFLNGFKVLNFIMINNKQSDILLLSRINLQLLKLLEQQKQYKQGLQNAKMCIDRICNYRDQYLTQGSKGSENRLLPFSLTCSNIKIDETLKKMQQKYYEQRNYIKKLKRINERRLANQPELSQQQLKEQQNQFKHHQKKDDIDEAIQKVCNNKTKNTELISLLSAVQLDILNMYFRATLKYAELLKVVERQSSNSVINGIKESSLAGLASTMKNKLSLMAGKYQSKNQKNLKQLQTTLIQAEKLPPPKPGLHWLQKKTIQQYQKNPYAMSLLFANFAAMNSQSEDKKYFLQQSLQNVEKCVEQQSKQAESAVNNSIFIFSTLWDDQIRPESSSGSISPFKQLYDGTWPCSAAVPDQPILISKNSTSITVKMPPFRVSGDKKKKQIGNMTLYGKPSANGVDVSTNCNELENTGLKMVIDKVVTVTSLHPNNIYCFACSPTTIQSQQLPIGRTSSDVRTCNPLPISMLASYLAKIAYQINQFDVAYNAAKIVVNDVCETTGYTTKDERNSWIYARRLKQNVLDSISLVQIRAISQSLYIMALCQKRKLNELKSSSTSLPPIFLQQKSQQITNYLMLASLLNPCLTSPLVSIPFLIPEDQIVLKALSLSLIPPKWMNSRLKELGVKVMEKVLKWGLQNNQIGLARRIAYKWAERKWLMLGKIIKIQEKKQVKKGGKDSKEQEVKMIDKYCRMLIEKAPGQLDLFQDSLAVVSDQYSDYTNLFIQRAKQQIAYYSQFVDNAPQQLQNWSNRLSSKAQLSQSLKQPMANLKKFPENSPFYLEYTTKLLRKAIQQCPQNPADLKTLLQKSQQLAIPANLPKQISLSKQIQGLILESIAHNIEWIPSAKMDIIKLQEKTGKNLSKEIQIYTDFQIKMGELTQSVGKMDTLIEREKDFDYLNLWISELYYLKAVTVAANCSKLEVKNPVKGKFDKIRLMNLQDLLKKKKQVEILDKESISYSQEQLKVFTQLLKLLSQSAFCSFCIQNWHKLQNIFKLLFNFLTKHLVSPFYHSSNASIWQYLAFISLMGIMMLKKIRTEGYETFKKRYRKKMTLSEIKLVATKLQLGYEPETLVQRFQPKYFMPELDPSTTKNYWFQGQSRLDLEAIGAVVAYTVQTLRLEGKYNLVINLTRDFCNVTQHYHSLQFLPFMIESQQKLIDEVKDSIDKQNSQLNQLFNEFTKKKASKMKGQRQHKLTNQPLPYQVQYEQKRKKIMQSMQLLTNHKNYLQSQIESSKTIIEQLKRDTSKTVLKQRQQRKYMAQFGDDEEHMFKNYGDNTRLALNRRSAIKDIIDQYEKIFNELKNNRTSVDTHAEIQNRNEVGNLYFATGNHEKAEQYWEDALATIFQAVRPVENYIEVLQKKKQPDNVLAVNHIPDKYIVLSLNLLYKISKFGSYKKLYYQYNCTKFASRLSTKLFQKNSDHPQNLLGHASYRLKKLQSDILQDESTINLSQLVHSLEYFSLRMIDMGNSIQALPMLNFYEHLAIDIIKNVQYSVRAKIIKGIVLANCGLISQALTYLAKIANEKDLPSLWVQPSDHMKREKGSNWYFEDVTFNNSKHWTDASNKQAIEYIKKITVKNQFVNSYGLASIPLFNYLKGLLLFKIFAIEIYDNYELNELRIASVSEAEGIMRDSLKKLGVLQQHYANLQEIEQNRIKLKKQQLNDQAEKAVETAKNAMISYLKANGVEEVLIPRYQNQKSTALKRVFRVQFMARIRMSIHQTYTSRRLTSNSYFVLKNCLTNIHRFSYGSRKVESGYDPQIGPAQPQQPPPGKKQDKKGSKKQQENVQIPKQAINWQNQRSIQQKLEQEQTRSSLNIFLHLKLTFELGKLFFQQNRFKTCINVFTSLIQTAKEYTEHYYSIFAQGYILRCELRLGSFNEDKFYQLIQLAQAKQYQRQEFVDLVMDFGEIVKGRDKLSVQMFDKGKQSAGKLWAQMGMKGVLGGIGLQNVQRMYSAKEQLTPQQQEQIKRKSKKAEKKPGKDDKKGAKKQDPKKKKQESKAEYKAQLLTKPQFPNLLQQQKYSVSPYILQPHPNYTANNIYSTLALQYIKCYIRHLQALMESKEDLLGQCQYINKLVAIVQSYRVNGPPGNANSGYYYLVHLYFCIAEINTNVFKNKLVQLIQQTPKSKLKHPYEDLPLNSSLINLPEFSQFLLTYKPYLVQAQAYYRKLIALVKSNCLLFDNGFKLDDVMWRAANNMLLLAQYWGRTKPKFYVDDKLDQDQAKGKLQRYNFVGEASSLLQISIKIAGSVAELFNNYSQLGSKPLQPTAKLDSDICLQISQIDKQFKLNYPKQLSQSLKARPAAPTTLQLLCYMSKIHRQSELCTFSQVSTPSITNTNTLQHILLRSHRMLIAGCPAYRDKCVISNVDFVPKKALEERNVPEGWIGIKLKSNGAQDEFIYLLGGNATESSFYGRLSVESVSISTICEKLYQIRSKIAISQKKSEAVKNRDFSLYQKQLKQSLIQIGKKFYPHLIELPESIKVSLTSQNINVLIKMLQQLGVSAINKQINGYLRYLHEMKYRLKDKDKDKDKDKEVVEKAKDIKQ